MPLSMLTSGKLVSHAEFEKKQQHLSFPANDRNSALELVGTEGDAETCRAIVTLL